MSAVLFCACNDPLFSGIPPKRFGTYLMYGDIYCPDCNLVSRLLAYKGKRCRKKIFSLRKPPTFGDATTRRYHSSPGMCTAGLFCRDFCFIVEVKQLHFKPIVSFISSKTRAQQLSTTTWLLIYVPEYLLHKKLITPDVIHYCIYKVSLIRNM